MSKCRYLSPLFAASLLLGVTGAAAKTPALMLAEVHHAGDPLTLSQWWISEKFDGVRAYWDGRQLWTRGGSPIAAPAWFTAQWPAQPLDGELWGGRGRFESTSATVRRSVADDDEWRALRYRVFDLPAQPGRFDQRLAALRAMRWPASIVPVQQFKLADAAALDARLAAVVAAGGEGLMLHRGDSYYSGGRSGDLLKYKPYDDAEATVIGYVAGTGKYTGLLGALAVRSDDGREFRLGSGLSDAQRRAPPPLGSRVTYSYNGVTASGLPRFARFVRVRDEPR